MFNNGNANKSMSITLRVTVVRQLMRRKHCLCWWTRPYSASCRYHQDTSPDCRWRSVNCSFPQRPVKQMKYIYENRSRMYKRQKWYRSIGPVLTPSLEYQFIRCWYSLLEIVRWLFIIRRSQTVMQFAYWLYCTTSSWGWDHQQKRHGPLIVCYQ